MRKITLSIVLFFLLAITAVIYPRSAQACFLNANCINKCTPAATTPDSDGCVWDTSNKLCVCSTAIGNTISNTAAGAAGALVGTSTRILLGPQSDVTCEGGTGIDTAIGCVTALSNNPLGTDAQTDLVGFILRWSIGVGGGIAFLLILYAGFQIMASQGDPNRLKAGQELLTAAISGLIMLIFSIFILRVIGVDILKVIPK